MPPPRSLRWRWIRDLLLVSDVLCVSAGLALAFWARFAVDWSSPLVSRTPLVTLADLVFIGLAWLVAIALNGLYARRNLVSGIGEYRRVFFAGATATLAVIVYAFFRSSVPISRGFLLLTFASVTVTVSAARFLVRRLIYAFARRGRYLDRVIIVGDNRQGAAVARQLITSPSASTAVVGFLSDYSPVGKAVIPGLEVLGEPLELEVIAERVEATKAIVVESGLWWESLRGLVQLMHRRGGVEIALVPGMLDLHSTPMEAQLIGPLLTLAPHQTRITGADAAMKRALDIVVAAAVLVLTLPLTIALAVASLLGGHRLGVGQERMVDGRGEFRTWRFTYSARVRRAHVSRLPNLLAVISGRMSLLGPRPVPVASVRAYADAMPFLASAKPGFIGPWWLVGMERPSTVEEELSYDLHYLRNYSIWMDIHILVQVARALAGGQHRLGWFAPEPDRNRDGTGAEGLDALS